MTLKKTVVSGIKNKELDVVIKIIVIIILIPFLLLEHLDCFVGSCLWYIEYIQDASIQ